MKADDKLQILKFFLMLVNSLFVILGISIFACSAWMLFDKDNFISVMSSAEEVKQVAGGLFVIGLVVVGVSLLGVIGAYLENRCFIASYLAFLIVIVLGQIFVTIVLLIKSDSIEKFLTNSVDNIIVQYGNGSETELSWNILDSVQSSNKCCGRQSSDDWKNNTVIRPLEDTNIYPCSCFNDTCPVILNGTHSFGKGSNVYKLGCKTALEEWLKNNIIVIFGMDLGLILVQVLQTIFGVYTYKCIGRKMTELHPSNLLNAMEESPSVDPIHQEDNAEYYQPEVQASNSQLDGGYNQGVYDDGGYGLGGYDHVGNDHSGYDHGGNDHRGYDHVGNDHRGYDHGGNDHRGYDHGGNDHRGYDHGSYNQGRYNHDEYIAEDYDQYNNHKFYEQRNSQGYNMPQIYQNYDDY